MVGHSSYNAPHFDEDPPSNAICETFKHWPKVILNIQDCNLPDELEVSVNNIVRVQYLDYFESVKIYYSGQSVSEINDRSTQENS